MEPSTILTESRSSWRARGDDGDSRRRRACSALRGEDAVAPGYEAVHRCSCGAPGGTARAVWASSALPMSRSSRRRAATGVISDVSRAASRPIEPGSVPIDPSTSTTSTWPTRVSAVNAMTARTARGRPVPAEASPVSPSGPGALVPAEGGRRDRWDHRRPPTLGPPHGEPSRCSIGMWSSEDQWLTRLPSVSYQYQGRPTTAGGEVVEKSTGH